MDNKYESTGQKTNWKRRKKPSCPTVKRDRGHHLISRDWVLCGSKYERSGTGGSRVLHCRALRNDVGCCISTELQRSVHRHTAAEWVFSKANAIGPLPGTHLYGKFNVEFQKMQKTLKRLTHFSAGGVCQSLC